MEEFPTNSKRQAPQPPPEKKIEPVVTGKVIQKKVSLGQRFTNVFFGGDAKGAFNYVVQNVLIPSAQAMFLDAVRSGSEHLVYREPRTGGYSSTKGSTWTPYGKFSTSGPIRKDESPTVSPHARATHNFGEIVLEDRVSAERVMNGMYDLLNEYELVKVSDYYSLLGVTSQYTDQKYGWTDLRGSDIRRVPQGFLLILPKPKPI